MAENKTQPTDADVAAFLRAVAHPVRRADGLRLDELFRRVTGWTPRIWGPGIVGYGSYDYCYDSGRTGRFLATGFAPRKASLSVYIMPGYADYTAILARLGKHKMGKSCLYISRLDDVDEHVLADLIRRGLEDLGAIWPVQPS